MTDLLQFATLDIQEPQWISQLSDRETYLHYPWNVIESAKRNPDVQNAAAAALRVLVASASINSMVSESIQTSTMIRKIMWSAHMEKTRKLVARGVSVDVAEKTAINDAKHEIESHIEWARQKAQRLAERKKETHDSSDDDGMEETEEMEVTLSEQEEIAIGGIFIGGEGRSEEEEEESNESETIANGRWLDFINVHDVENRAIQYKHASLFQQTGSVLNVLERMEKQELAGLPVRRLQNVLLKGVTKHWHQITIIKAIAAKEGGAHRLGSAALIASIRKLACNKLSKTVALNKARLDLHSRVFENVKMMPAKYCMNVVPVPEMSLCHLALQKETAAQSRWSLVRHTVVSSAAKPGGKAAREAAKYGDRLYYTVSTWRNRHNVNPLWELLPPELLMTALGTPASYSVQFDEGKLGLVFSSTKNCGTNFGVSIAEIIAGSQADSGKYGNISVGDQLNRVNGQSVRGSQWTKRKVIDFIRQAKRPMLLSFSGKGVRRFVANLHETTPTKRWAPGCEDSVWEAPANSIFRIFSVQVQHKDDVDPNLILSGGAVPLFGGCGLLDDKVSGVKDAYVVGISELNTHEVYNVASIEFNRARITRKFMQLAKSRTAQNVILETFASGFRISRTKHSGDRTLCVIGKGTQSRLGLLHDVMRTSKSEQVVYQSTMTILEMVITAQKSSMSSAATTSLLDLLRGDEEDFLLKMFQPGLTTLNPTIRGHVSSMYSSTLVLK